MSLFKEIKANIVGGHDGRFTNVIADAISADTMDAKVIDSTTVSIGTTTLTSNANSVSPLLSVSSRMSTSFGEVANMLAEDIFPLNDVNTTLISGLPATADKYRTGVLARNGKIYCLPSAAGTILIINTLTNTTSTIPAPVPGSFYGGVLAANDKIYAAPVTPNAPTDLLVINTLTDTSYTVSTGVAVSGSNQWWGGALAPNGNIYFAQQGQPEILVVNPVNDSVTTINNAVAGPGRWAGAVTAPNGNIYCVPFNDPNVAVIDTNTNTVSTIAVGSSGWAGGVLAPNGFIYCVPRTATSILKIDTVTNTVTTFGVLGAGVKYLGGVLAPNGKIYCAPFSVSPSTVLVIDPGTDTITTVAVPSGTGTTDWAGAVVGRNNKVYFVPCSNTAVLIMKTGLPSLPEWMLAPMFNKF